MIQYLRAALACLAVYVVILAWALMSGCNTQATPTWSAAYEEDWRAACTCWGVSPSRPETVERDDCMTSPNGTRYFATPYSPTGYATGIFIPGAYRVEWCDERALIHEFSHAVKYATTGDPGKNYSGRCWL